MIMLETCSDLHFPFVGSSFVTPLPGHSMTPMPSTVNWFCGEWITLDLCPALEGCLNWLVSTLFTPLLLAMSLGYRHSFPALYLVNFLSPCSVSVHVVFSRTEVLLRKDRWYIFRSLESYVACKKCLLLKKRNKLLVVRFFNLQKIYIALILICFHLYLIYLCECSRRNSCKMNTLFQWILSFRNLL